MCYLIYSLKRAHCFIPAPERRKLEGAGYIESGPDTPEVLPGVRGWQTAQMAHREAGSLQPKAWFRM